MLDLLVWVPLLVDGLGRTLLLFAAVLALGFPLGVLTGLARLSRRRALRWLANAYVEVFRGASLYVTLFWLYFAVPFLGIRLGIWEAAVIGCTLTHAAYASEYVRAAVLSVPASQHEAAVALGMSAWQRVRHVVLPQAFVALVPLMGSEFVMLLKGTAVVSLIGLAELTEEAHSVIVSTYRSVPVLLTVLVVYFVVAQLILWTMARLEARFDVWKRRPASGLAA